jgi:hypothetical protein
MMNEIFLDPDDLRNYDPEDVCGVFPDKSSFLV